MQGDRSVEAVAVAARVTMKRATEFLHKFVSCPLILATSSLTMSSQTHVTPTMIISSCTTPASQCQKCWWKTSTLTLTST